MKESKILNINCANCPLNDGMIYTSMPPKFRCTVTNEYNLGEHRCGRVKIFYDDTIVDSDNLAKAVPINAELPLASSGEWTGQIYNGYLNNQELINLVLDVDNG